MLHELRYYSRMAVGIWQMMRSPLPSDPRGFLRRQFENREANFLDTVRRVIFADPSHPYAVMFRLAGCEFGDLEDSVLRYGLEPALSRLRSEGVYLAHDEWKEKIPVVRAGREIVSHTKSFSNPLVTGWIEGASSGSRGRPVVTSRSTASQIHRQLYQIIRAREFQLQERAWIHVKPILPSAAGLNSCLRGRKVGAPADRWFSVGSTFADYGHYRLATRGFVALGNMLGAHSPYPTYLPPNDFSPVAAHIARRRGEGQSSVVAGIASPLVRVASAAMDKGLDISGTLFCCGGEALTPGKLKVFEAAGAEATISYAISEVGHVGLACRQMPGNCVHVMEDSVAAITFRRPALYTDVEVDSLHFTTLLPYAPNVFINIEMDDDGVIEPARCDCEFSRLGFSHRINHIASFGKVTPHGMTFHGTDLVRVLEEVLPSRLGGHPGDYQLVECEGPNHHTMLRLHVSPRVKLADVNRVRDVFLEHMRGQWGGALATRLWAHSGAVEAVVSEPYVTRTGKVHAIRLLGAFSTNGQPVTRSADAS